MPLIVVTRDPNVLTDHHARFLAPALQNIVAEALDAPDDKGGDLTPDQIEVRFRDIGPLDTNASPLGIEIFANDFPSRKANIDERTRKICRELRVHSSVPTSVIDNKGGFVWVFLGAAGFEFL